MELRSRLTRFTDWRSVRPLCSSGKVGSDRPFYAGDSVAQRMDLVRHAINDIRTRWNEYPTFMRELRALMGAGQPSSRGSMGDAEAAQRLFHSVKTWSDERSASASDHYSAIRLYTSEAGYRQIFGLINAAFRDEDLTTDTRALRAATFLVELLTIDLYNYHRTEHLVDNFVGTVYRGMSISADQLQMFKRAAKGPISQRYLAIPLAMVSATTNRDVATSFILNVKHQPYQHPVLWEIKVASLDDELITLYHSLFPQSIVTSLCAVPIDRLSLFPDESEVLLRGPFFQLLRIREEEVSGRAVHLMDALMLNCNRDHGTATASNQGEDKLARDVFRALIGIQRHGICTSFAENQGMSADADCYRAARAKEVALLDSLV